LFFTAAGGAGCTHLEPDSVATQVRVERVEQPGGVSLSPKLGSWPLVVYHLTVLDPPHENENVDIRSMEWNGRWGRERETFTLRFRGSFPFGGDLEPSRILSYEKIEQ
jgi:hypothetical protein